MRATKGVADTTRGGIMAVGPMVLPTIARVTGSIATSNRIKVAMYRWIVKMP